MRKLHLTLTAEERQTLEEAVHKHPRPYVRERAGALLKFADGQLAKDIAARGLLQKRCKQTVSTWIKRYNRLGLGGLYHQSGRGRRRAFFPSE